MSGPYLSAGWILASTQSSEARCALRGRCELRATQVQQQYLAPNTHRTSSFDSLPMCLGRLQSEGKAAADACSTSCLGVQPHAPAQE